MRALSESLLLCPKLLNADKALLWVTRVGRDRTRPRSHPEKAVEALQGSAISSVPTRCLLWNDSPTTLTLSPLLLAPMNRDYENFARTNPPSITLECTNDVTATLPHPK